MKTNLLLLSITLATATACSPARRDVASAPAIKAPSSLSVIKPTYGVGDVTKACDAAMAKAQTKLDAIPQIPAQQRTFANTMLALENITADLSDETTPLTFMGYVSTSDKTRAEGADCEDRVGQFLVKIFSRKDIYASVKDAVPGNDDEKRLLTETLKGFEKNGLNLPDDQLSKVTELRQRLSSLQTKFSANLNNDATTIALTAEELAGAPGSYLSGLKKDDQGRYIVTTRESDSAEVAQKVTSSEARKKFVLAYNNRGGEENTKLLTDAVTLRAQIAAALGYKTWADYQIDGRMAKDASTVLTFLNGLKDKLAERNRQDIDKLLAFKKQLEPGATQVEPWDISYLAYQLKKRDYSLDEDAIRAYFPADVVVQGMFDVYSQMLGVHYVEVKSADVWAPDVKLYEIRDNKDERSIGFFYTDFYPRPGKYGHAASFPIISARMTPDGYTRPVAAIVANLTKPADGKPSLLTHDDVVTIFHEFGHIMHQTLTRAPYASLSGSAVAQDFVEAPSQMLENWCWDADILNSLSGNYMDHSKKLPADLLSKMIEARDFNQGYYYTRQLLLALFDMMLHTQTNAVDVTKTYDDMYGQILGVQPLQGGHFAGTFGHLMGGYDAGYYGYLWSEVYAADMFSVFQKSGLRDPVMGANYRKNILERGNMSEAIDLLKDFLGREPSTDAFYRKLHIGP